MPLREVLQVLLLALLNFTHIVDFMIMMPLGPQLMRLFAISPKQFGLLVSAYTFAAGISGFAGAMFLDRFERRRALMTVYVGFLLGTLACGLVPTYELLLGARIVTGLFGGALAALVLAIVSDLVPPERRGRGIGLVMTAFSMATVIGVPLSLYFVQVFHTWHAPFLFLASFGVSVFFLIGKFIPTLSGHLQASGRQSSWRELLDSVSSARERIALLVGPVSIMGNFTIIPFISTYMVLNAKLPEARLPWMYMLGGTATFFTSPMVGKLADRFGAARIFLIAAPVAIFPTFMLTNLPPSETAAILLVTTCFFIFNHARFVPAMTLVTLNVNARHRGAFMSLNSCVQQVASGFASLLGGYLVSQTPTGELVGFGRLAWISAGAVGCSMLLVGKLRRYSPELRRGEVSNLSR